MGAAHLQNKGVCCLHFAAPAVNCVLYDLRYRTLSAIAKQWPVRRLFKVCRGIQGLVLACSGLSGHEGVQPDGGLFRGIPTLESARLKQFEGFIYYKLPASPAV